MLGRSGSKQSPNKQAPSKPANEHKPKAPSSKPATGMLDALGANAFGGVKPKRHSAADVNLDEPLKRKAGQAAAPSQTPHEPANEAKQGAGKPLPTTVQRDMEARFGADFSGVRVHDDAAANRAAAAIQALAFTVGRDISFAEGRYAPETPEGRELLAHELAHVAQNERGPLRKKSISEPGDASEREADAAARAVMRNEPVSLGAPPGARVQRNKTPAAGGGATKATKKLGSIDFPSIQVDKIGLDDSIATAYATTPLVRGYGYSSETRGRTKQGDIWRRDPELKDKVAAELAKKPKLNDAQGDKVSFRAPNQESYYFGSLSEVARELTIPTWTNAPGGERPKSQTYQVDHIIELQLSGWSADTQPAWANTVRNMWLLDSTTNQKSGREIDDQINKLLEQKLAKDTGLGFTSTEEARAGFDICFAKAHAGKSKGDFWTYKQICEGVHLKGLEPAAAPGQGEAFIFAKKVGGFAARIPLGAGDKSIQGADKAKDRFAPLKLLSVNLSTEAGSADKPLGTITLGPPDDSKTQKSATDQSQGTSKAPPKSHDLVIKRVPGFVAMGYVYDKSLREAFELLQVKHLSPLDATEIDFGPKGLVSSGKLLSTLPIMQKADIGFFMDGKDLGIEKTFSSGDLDVPKPFRVSDVGLRLRVGTTISADGHIHFGIDRVGQGSVEAHIDPSSGFLLDGKFQFDRALFKGDASIEAHYAKGEWAVAGDLAIPEGRIPGIKRGSIHVGYGQGKLSASGDAEVSIPGVQSAHLEMQISETEGLVLAGNAVLSDSKLVKRGQVVVRLRQGADGTWQVTARGEAEPNIPGVASRLQVSYEDGTFDAFVQAGFEKGRLKGSLGVGITNRQVDKDGKPMPGNAKASATPSEQLTAYGGGSATLQLTKWLQGTAGIKILPAGEVEIAGKIAVPSSIEVFPAYGFDKELVKIGMSVPIFGPLVASISGGLSASASIGPGTLEDAHLDVVYNPAHEEQLHVSGGARFHVPAFVGVRLFVRGGIGLSVVVASVEGFVEVGAQLGLKGAADMAANVDYRPNKGFSLDAFASISAEPSLKFDLALGYEARALLWTHTQKWQLAAYDLGSGIKLGVLFPVHYQDDKPFKVSPSDVQFVIPEIKLGEIIPKLVRAARGSSSDEL